MRIAAVFATVLLFIVGVTASQVSRPADAEECDPNYSGYCIPAGIPDIDCKDVPVAVKVVGVDIHGLDGDTDGVGCEANDPGRKTAPSSTKGTSEASASKTCKVVFVAGKGIVDSCSSEHKDTSRVYPRKAGIPANGCAETCPEVTDESAQKQGTPTAGDSTKPSAAPSNQPTGPVDTEYTAPIDTGQTPTPAQNCDRVSYPDICVPPAPPYLSCSDIPDRNFRVRAPDPHRFDADNNGIGCEEVRGPSIGR